MIHPIQIKHSLMFDFDFLTLTLCSAYYSFNLTNNAYKINTSNEILNVKSYF